MGVRREARVRRGAARGMVVEGAGYETVRYRTLKKKRSCAKLGKTLGGWVALRACMCVPVFCAWPFGMLHGLLVGDGGYVCCVTRERGCRRGSD